MKKIKSVLSIILIIATALSLSLISFAEEAEDISKRVKMTNFQYVDSLGNPVNTLTADTTIHAIANLERTSVGIGSQKYVFVTFVYNDDKLVDVIKQEGEVSTDDTEIPAPLFNEIELPEVLNNAKVKTLLLEDMIDFKPLASPADFGSNSGEILELYANNKLLQFDAGLNAYNYSIPLLNSSYPVIFDVVLKNAASSFIINNITGYLGTANVTVTSHSGTKIVPYNINVTSSGIPDGVATRYGSKIYYAAGKVGTGSLPTTSSYTLLTRNTIAGGSLYVAFFEFELPDVPSDANYTATLELYSRAQKEDHNLKFYECTDSEWDTKEYAAGGMPSMNTSNPISDEMAVSPFSSEYAKSEIPLKTEQLKGKEKIVIAVRAEFGTGNGYVYLSLKDHPPVIKYTVTQ